MSYLRHTLNSIQEGDTKQTTFMEELFRNPHLINPNNASQLVQSTNSMEFDHNDSNHVIVIMRSSLLKKKKKTFDRRRRTPRSSLLTRPTLINHASPTQKTLVPNLYQNFLLAGLGNQPAKDNDSPQLELSKSGQPERSSITLCSSPIVSR